MKKGKKTTMNSKIMVLSLIFKAEGLKIFLLTAISKAISDIALLFITFGMIRSAGSFKLDNELRFSTGSRISICKPLVFDCPFQCSI